ncbi:MAG: DUF1127 domain-containing protein [Pseudomonadota bacterium]
MAYFDATARVSSVAGTSFFSRVSAAVQRYRVYRETKAELNALGARELDDLGIAPADIEGIAQRAAGYL